MIKKLIIIIMLVVLLYVLSQTAFEALDNTNAYSRDYYVNNTYKQTGSENIVTGIYLDYRLFDSIFEASILIIVVSGIIFITKRDDEVL